MATNYNYSAIDEIIPFTRHLLAGQTSFNSTTRPTASDVRQMLVMASEEINDALAGEGFTVPVTDAEVKRSVSSWVSVRAAYLAELAQRGVGFNDGEGSRTAALMSTYGDAMEYVKARALAWKRRGAGQSQKLSDGLTFTGLDAQADRADPDDTSLAQPKFKRGLFDTPGGTGYMTVDEDGS